MSESRLFSKPSYHQVNASEMQAFIRRVGAKPGLSHVVDFWTLHAWSVSTPEDFWNEIWDWGGIIGAKGVKVFDSAPAMSSTGTRLPFATLNYAENILLSHSRARSSKLALATVIESLATAADRSTRTMSTYSFAQLYSTVQIVAERLKRLGVKPGDGVAAYSPSNGEAAILMLATSSLGGIWSAVAAEAGPKAALERLQQTRPKVLLGANEVIYNGKVLAVATKLLQVVDSLSHGFGLEHVIVVGQLLASRECDISSYELAISTVGWHAWNGIRAPLAGLPSEMTFWRGPAMAPVWVLFSSGTTGQPKAIVHHAGGMILAQKMTNRLHHDMGENDVCLQFTTPGWMMWNVAVSMMGMGASTIFYDGSPLATHSVLWDIVEKFGCTYLGCSPRYLQILSAAKFHPGKLFPLKSLKTMQLAGAPLTAELYDFVRDSIKSDLYLNNASGGTDVCGCFVGSSPTLPVYYGEISAPILGMSIQSWNEDGKPDKQGNMVCTTPFPNQPLGFLNDQGDERYESTYFSDYPEVWNQSDWIEITSVGGILMLGRSDGVLNPQGVRFGSAELYAVTDEMKDAIDDCIAVGQMNKQKDERVVLFVKPVAGGRLDSRLVARLKIDIAAHLSKRHVPSKFIECPDIPYTHTLKRVEVAVKKLVNGAKLESINTSAIGNPESLKFFVDHPDLRDVDHGRAKL